jgi:hypothetical protein
LHGSRDNASIDRSPPDRLHPLKAMARTRWTNRLLDQMRQAGDPPAEAVVQELDDDDEIDAVNRLMQTLVRNDDVPRAKLPKVVRSLSGVDG